MSELSPPATERFSRARAFWRVRLGCDLRSLALLRVVLGSLILVDLLMRCRDFSAHYLDNGLLPRHEMLRLGWHTYWFSLHMAAGDGLHTGLLFGLQGLAALALACGYRTRLSAVLCWFLLSSLHARNPIILTSGDVLLRLLLFWGFFLPWGEVWSWDARGRQKPASYLVCCPGTVAYLAQVVLLYQFAYLWKNHPSWHSEGTAVYYILSLDQFVTPAGQALLAYPQLMKGLTFLTLYLEGACTFLLLVPLPIGFGLVRTLAVAAFVSLHLGIGLCIHIGIFTFVAASASLGLLPAWFWERVLRRPSLSGPRRAAPPGAGWQALCGALLAYVIWWNLADWKSWPMPAICQIPAEFLMIEQRWSMFAPYPLKDDGWFALEGKMLNGASVEMIRGGTFTESKPAQLSGTFPSDRWRKLFLNFYDRRYAPYRIPYMQWMMRNWNESHRGNWRVKSVNLWFFRETTPAPGQPAPRVEKVFVGDWINDL